MEQDPPFCVPPRPKFSRHVQDMGEDSQRGPRWKIVRHKEDLGILPYHQQEIEWLGALLRTIVLENGGQAKGPA
jgi:hypothetical protein